MTKKQAAQHAAYLAELAAARQAPRCVLCTIVKPAARSEFRCLISACPKTFTPMTPTEIRQREHAESPGGAGPTSPQQTAGK